MKKKFLGILIILVSLPIYSTSFLSFFLVALLGWTSDNPNQPVLESLYARLLASVLFFSNISLSLAGVQISRNKLKISTILLLIFGLGSAVYFYTQSYSNYTDAYNRLQRGEVKEPIDELSKIIQTKNEKWAYEKRGAIYYGLSRFKEAFQDFNSIHDYKTMALAALRLNDFQNALKICDEWAAAETPYRAYFWKGNILYQDRQYQKAIEAYEAGFKIMADGADSLGFIRLSSCYTKLGDFAQAEAALDRASSMAEVALRLHHNDSDGVRVWVARGNLDSYRGLVAKAEESYKQALQKNRFWAIREIPSSQLKKMGVSENPPSVNSKDPSGKIFTDMSKMDFELPSLT